MYNYGQKLTLKMYIELFCTCKVDIVIMFKYLGAVYLIAAVNWFSQVLHELAIVLILYTHFYRIREGGSGSPPPPFI